MQKSTNPLFLNYSSFITNNYKGRNLLGTRFIIDYNNSILEISNKDFLTKINFPIVFENDQYIFSDWLKNKLTKFRNDTMISATLTSEILVDNEPITLAINFTKKDKIENDFDIIVELHPLYYEQLWQFQENKYSSLFYHSFQKNPVPMIILDKNLSILAMNDSYKKTFAFTIQSSDHQTSLIENFSNASREKIIAQHAKRLLDPHAVPSKYTLDLVDNNGNKHSCFIQVEFVNPQQDSVISIISSSLNTSLSFDYIAENSKMHIPFYQSPIITFITSFEGKILDANQSFFIITGMNRRNLKNTFWFDFTEEKQATMHQEFIHKLKANNSVENIKIVFDFPVLNPSKRNTLLSARLIEFNKKTAIIFTIIDVSTVPHLTNDLFHMEELKVASELAASVGHEVRNPMTAVRGFLQMLSKKPDLDKYQSYFDLMLEELDRANQIITEYLSLAKTKTNKSTMENLNAIIEQLFPLLQITAINADQKIQLDLSPSSDLYLDGKEIRQLILNMVKNGLEAMEPGKTLTIKTYQNTINSVMLEIKDEGSGIPPNILDKIGSPFFTTKANGTGLGLSICYTIARKNNATIRVESSTTGTSFFIEFTKL